MGNSDNKLIVTNSTDGSFFFEGIKFTKPGTYTFTVKEVIPDEATADNNYTVNGIVYDTNVFDVTVVVVDNNGKLEASVTDGQGNSIVVQFTNTYTTTFDKSTAVNLEGSKTLTGRDIVEGEFFYVVEAIDDAPLTGQTTLKPNIDNNDEDELYNNISLIENLTFTEAGIYKYTFKEQIPTGATLISEGEHKGKYFLDGVIYDSSVYKLTVTVTDDGNGRLYVSNKELEVDETGTGENYKTASTVQFNNIYIIQDYQYDTNWLTKVLDGDKTLESEMFEFTNKVISAKDSEEKDISNDNLNDYIVLPANAKNDEEGYVKFEDIVFKKAGTYRVEISEVIPEGAKPENNYTLNGITYTTDKLIVEFVVTDKGDGTFRVDLTVIEGSYTFTNTYSSTGTYSDLKITKNFTGREGNVWLDSDVFEFVLEVVDTDTKQAVTDGFVILPTNLTITADSENKTPSFDAITFTKAGTYKFIVREKASSMDNGIVYDATAREVIINVIDKGDGTLTATLDEAGSDDLIFENVYKKDSIALSGHDYLQVQKTLSGRKWTSNDEFQFILTSNDPTTIDALKNGYIEFLSNKNTTISTDGLTATLTVNSTNYTLVHFGNIKFNKNGVFEFVIREVLPDGATEENGYTVDGIKYDNSVKTFKVLVVDNNNGELVITKINDTEVGFNPQPVPFENTYTVTEVDVTDITIKKEITGRDWLTTDAFSFTLVAGDDETESALSTDDIIFEGDTSKEAMNVTISNGNTNESGDHYATFGKITFKKGGTYTFHVTENGTNITGISKDSHIYEVVVSVTDNGEGSLLAAVKSAESGESTFVNTFTPKPIDVYLEGTKNLTGRSLREGDFRFNIVGVNNSYEQTVNHTNENGETADIVFGPIKYTKAGVYEYTISEIIGNLPSVTYDRGTVKATVTVTQDEYGQLAYTIAYTKGDSNESGETFVFNNTYDAIDTDPVNISAKKIVNPSLGNIYTLEKDDFTFIVIDKDENTWEVTNDKEGNVEILSDKIFSSAGDYVYTVYEKDDSKSGIKYDDEVYTITIKVTDNVLTGKLETKTIITNAGGETVDSIVFNNKYNPTETSVLISGIKTLESEHKSLDKSEFKFKLEGVENSDGVLPPMPDTVETSNTITGFFQFGTIHYTTPGVYTYKVSEIDEGKDGYSYDSTEYTVIVTVTDNEGELTKDVVYKVEESEVTAIEFTNSYTPNEVVINDPTKVGPQITATKELTGRDIVDEEFTFVLKDNKGETVSTGTNYGNTIEFTEFSIEKAGTYYYTISEEPGTKNGVTYDLETQYTVEVVVVDSVDDDAYQGQLTVESIEYKQNDITITEDEVIFRNTYSPASTSVKIGATKILEGRTIADGEFNFAIVDSEGNQVRTATNIGNVVSFEEITYDQEGVYTYTVIEVQEDANGISYDDSKYEFTVTVEDDLDGHLVATISDTAKSIVFTNTYNAPEISIVKVQEINGVEYGTEDGIIEVEAGDKVTYYIRVNNAEDVATAKNVIITDTVPEGLELVSINGDGTYDKETGIITWNIGQLGGTTGVEVSFTVKVPEVEENTEWENIATVKYNNGKDPENPDEPNEIGESNKVEIISEAAPELTPIKTQSINGGDATEDKAIIKNDIVNKIKYTITVTAKEGTNDATNVVVTDELPKGTTLVEGSITEGGTIKDGVITWNIGTLEAGKSITLEFEVEVAKDVDVKEINNQANVTWEDEPDDDDDNPEDFDKPTNEVEIDVEKTTTTKTGDDNNIALYAGGLGVAAIGMVALVVSKKKKKEE